MRTLYADGVGFWTPGFATWAAWSAGPRDPGTPGTPVEPACAGVAPRLLRGTSLVTRIALDVLGQAAGVAGVDLATVPTVFGSGLGEIQTAVALLRMIAAEGLPSPLRFKNSVHNAASGAFGIAYGNPGFSTALSAGGDLVAMALLEAWTWLDAHGGALVLVLSEEGIPAPLPGHGAYLPVGFALHLRAERPPGNAWAALDDLRRGPVPADTPDPSAVEGYRGNPCAPAFALVEAVAARRPGVVALAAGDDAGWCVTVATGPKVGAAG